MTSSQSLYEKSIQIANMLGQKAMQAKTKESLTFLILNDTINMLRYDRSLLWDLSRSKPKLLGISGESKINKQSPQVKKWTKSIEGIVEPSRAQIINFSHQEEESSHGNVTMLWLPILVKGKPLLGLWIELWNTDKKAIPPKEMLQLLINFLMPVYGIAWEKFHSDFGFSSSDVKKWSLYSLAVAAVVLSFIIQIPLRLVAPCEIVPKNPILVTAPLEGIIEDITVKPGDSVEEGSLLFNYDSQAPLKGLEMARKQVEILVSEIKRASTLGFKDPEAMKDLATLRVKLEKEKINLELAEYHASQLQVTAPAAGVIMLDNPDEWRGNPVQIGEKVLAITNPKHSKIRIWLPEGDNASIDVNKPLKIYLNVSPEKSYTASLTYIANESIISDKQIPSFIAEADWINKPQDIRLGLKGTAVLYGEQVSLVYYIFRKPWGYLRMLLGI